MCGILAAFGTKDYQKAISQSKAPVPLDNNSPCLIETKNQYTIEQLCINQGFDASQVVKVILNLAILEDNKEYPILVSLRGDQELNEVKLSNYISKHLAKGVVKIKSLSKNDAFIRYE